MGCPVAGTQGAAGSTVYGLRCVAFACEYPSPVHVREPIQPVGHVPVSGAGRCTAGRSQTTGTDGTNCLLLCSDSRSFGSGLFCERSSLTALNSSHHLAEHFIFKLLIGELFLKTFNRLSGCFF